MSTDINRARSWYKLTVEGEKKIINFPLTSIPWLNQTMKAVRYKVAIDPFESRWFSLMLVLKKAIDKINLAVSAKFGRAPFYSIDEYRGAFKAFDQGIQVSFTTLFLIKVNI